MVFYFIYLYIINSYTIYKRQLFPILQLSLLTDLALMLPMYLQMMILQMQTIVSIILKKF